MLFLGLTCGRLTPQQMKKKKKNLPHVAPLRPGFAGAISGRTWAAAAIYRVGRMETGYYAHRHASRLFKTSRLGYAPLWGVRHSLFSSPIISFSPLK
jgi:hypothetical protein